GTERATGRAIAVKFLTTLGRPDLEARFVREARLLARVRHPHVLEVVDAGETGGRAYVVSELCEGGTLRARLTVGRRGARSSGRRAPRPSDPGDNPTE